ncbi:MAG TPA: substrate-binding domain-containing protein [Solirubrobacteraceae bacterium]|nr:substrate-binding domain-containing protein [Solirubrobacteraceae bacterium]
MSLRARSLALIALLVGLMALVAAGCGDDEESGGGGASSGSSEEKKTYKVGVSNTLVGNGWREEMICSVKAQSLASGQVDEVLVHNVNGDASAQIAGIRNLISGGANAIIANPADREALNPVIKEAAARDIVFVAVDQAVTAPEAYVVTNDQVAYGRLGAEWLAESLGGKGNIVEMRGISGVPADDDRHKGFMEVIEANPDMKIVKETFTDWSFAPAGKQANDILSSNTQVDAIWTSGIDYVVVDALAKAGQESVPVIGADNNKFLEQLKDGAPGAAVTNPAAIGGVGTAIALAALNGEEPEKVTTLTPEVWDMESASDKIEEFYDPELPPTYSNQMLVEPYTTYTKEQLTGCQGP